MEVSDILILIAEITGVIAFSVSGTLVGIKHELDLVGIIIVGTITAVGGGCLRDILLGSFPPQMFQSPLFTIVAAATAVLVMTVEYFVSKHKGKTPKVYETVVNIFDALGLGVFVTVGIDIANHAGYGENAFLSIFVATISGVGGGIMRDMIVNEIPMILRKQIYIIPAILGSALYYYLARTKLPEAVCIAITVILVLTIRIMAATYRWDLPHFKARREAKKQFLILQTKKFKKK